MVKVINGPGFEIWAKKTPFQVIFDLENHKAQQLTIENIKRREEDKHTLDFVTTTGAHGSYNVKTKKGEINFPLSLLISTSETAPIIGS